MAKAIVVIAMEQSVMTITSYSHKIQNFTSKVSNGVEQAIAYVVKQRSIAIFNLPQIMPRGMDEIQTHTNPAFQPIGLEDDDHLSSNSSATSPKGITLFTC